MSHDLLKDESLTELEIRSAFIKTFREVGRERHRFEVFSDVVTLFAIEWRNAYKAFADKMPVLLDDKKEQEYISIIKKYKKEDHPKFALLFRLLVDLHSSGRPKDHLGDIYMSLDFGDSSKGQFFTPSHVSDLMARLSMSGFEEVIKSKGFITLGDPACGAGSTFLAVVSMLMQQGYDPRRHLWIEGTDIDRVAALMCYTQLAMWGVPAMIYVGNSLSQEIREVWPTPTHMFEGWDLRLENRQKIASTQKLAETSPAPASVRAEQLDFSF